MKLFVYGTLKKGFGNNIILRNCEMIDRDSLMDFEMRSVGWFPAINKKEGGSVFGEVYRIDPLILRRTDGLEGYPTHYHREIVHTVGGHEVWAYYYRHLFNDLPVVSSGIWGLDDGY